MKSKFGPEQEIFLMLFLVICIIAWAMGNDTRPPRAVPVEEPLPTQLTLRDENTKTFFTNLSANISPEFGERLNQAAIKLDQMARQHRLDAVEVVGFADGSVIHPGTIFSGETLASFKVQVSHSLGDFDCLAAAWLANAPYCQVPVKDRNTLPVRTVAGRVLPQDFTQKDLVSQIINSNIELGMLRAMAVIRHLRIAREADRGRASSEGREPILSRIREFLPLSAGSYTSERYELLTVMDGLDNPSRRRIDIRLFSLADRTRDAAR